MDTVTWLPPIVAGRFRVEALERDPSSIVGIAPDGRIGWANRAWFSFGRENGATTATIDVGANYLAAICGEVRPVFEGWVAGCLASGDPFELEYECSSATVYRSFHLRMLPLSGKALLLVHTLTEMRPCDRPSEPPDEARYRDEFGLIAECSNCRRIRDPVDSSWHWIPAWVETTPRWVTHVICPICRGFYWPKRSLDG
jgi:hypothetical protein